MGLFGPSREERLATAVATLTSPMGGREAAEYLSAHFQQAWPRLEAV